MVKYKCKFIRALLYSKCNYKYVEEEEEEISFI